MSGDQSLHDDRLNLEGANDSRQAAQKRARMEDSVSNVAMDTAYADKTAKIQKETLAKSYSVAVAQVADIPMGAESTPFVIVDLGVADGINSIPLFKGCVEEVKKRDTNKSIWLAFDDQPCNDFSQITKMDQHLFGSNCFPIITAISFFKPTMPRGTVHLSYSSHSMHYLAGGPPCNFKMTGLKDTDAVGEEKAMFAATAAKDWERLLLARASELAVGGRSVLSNLCVDESTGWYYSSTDYGKSLYTEVSDCLRSMVNDGLLTDLEFEWATSPEYYRTIAEHKLPFEDPNGPVPKAGLRLKSAEIQVSRCPLRAEWVAGKHASAEEYGKEFAWVCTSFTYHKVMRAFENPSNARPEAEQKKLADEAFARLAKRVAADPLSFGVDTVCLVMVIEKVS